MADRPADRRSVQDFVRNVINAVTNLHTRSNQRGNNEESSRAVFESITDEVNAQFQIPRQGSRGRRTATATTSVRTVTGQVARKSSRPKSCRPKPESCRPKYIVMSPDILSHVARNFIDCINLKKSNILSQSQGINS